MGSAEHDLIMCGRAVCCLTRGLLAALPDLHAEFELRRQLVSEAYRSGHADGWRRGYERGARLRETEWPAIVAPLIRDRLDYVELEQRRLTVRGEQRTRDTYALPHPADFPGRVARA